jgi:hypothetical protein
MDRESCLQWLKEHNYPIPPKSACIGCPFHNDAQWLELRVNSPNEWQDAIEVDTAIREQSGLRGKQFMHRSCVPLSEVPLVKAADQFDLFTNECEGICGT